MISWIKSIFEPPEIININVEKSTTDGGRHHDVVELSPAEIIQKVKEAGVLGMGGGEFPAHRKLSPRRVIDWVLINGCESEPMISCDDAVLKKYRHEVECGMKLIMRAVGAKNGKIVTRGNSYASGYEKILVEEFAAIRIPNHHRPQDYGYLVFNVQTARAIHQAVCLGLAQRARVLSVHCGCTRGVRNVEVKIGTRAEAVFEALGCTCQMTRVLIKDGLMMGRQIEGSTEVRPGTIGLFSLHSESLARGPEQVCINCGYCGDDCPVGLAPKLVCWDQSGEAWEKCIECGYCDFICPSGIRLMERIRRTKSEAGHLGGEGH
ncbi:MAG: hypothetical protein H6624_17065 [Bdellovibrionaceae bacterium]|nr:hypothetical protein [Bdellovibrionales bacterium]MCB9086058.1 hypothetical protein [Pseudobdellovibrionaceae bacterium]